MIGWYQRYQGKEQQRNANVYHAAQNLEAVGLWSFESLHYPSPVAIKQAQALTLGPSQHASSMPAWTLFFRSPAVSHAAQLVQLLCLHPPGRVMSAVIILGRPLPVPQLLFCLDIRHLQRDLRRVSVARFFELVRVKLVLALR